MDQHVVLTKPQLEAIASPTRMRLFEMLIARSEATASELSADTGLSSATALYHLRLLTEVGLVREIGQRPSGKRPSALFAPSAKRYELPKGDEAKAERIHAVQAGIRRIARDFVAAGGKDTHLLRVVSRLTTEDQRQFEALLEAAANFAKSHYSANGEDLVWMSIACPPRRAKRVQ